MKCFIASAFGQQDVDALYRRAVQPVLREYRITPLRVDRVEHNEDIDDKIFSLLDAADFCIADLTYARPSVYYEAGYAFAQGKSVIYIVRDDHFRARPDDPHGNERVHFDLQMKNIISWKVPDDAFRQRLRKRVRHVIAPLLLAAKRLGVADSQEREFSALSQHQQLATLTSEGQQLLFSRGFKTIPHKAYGGWRPGFVARVGRVEEGVCQQVYLTAHQSVTKKHFNGLHWWMQFLSPSERAQYTEIQSILLTVCLRATSDKILAGWMPRCDPLGDKVFRHEEPDEKGEPRRRNIVVVIDGIKCIGDFVRRFRGVAARLELDRHRRTR